MKLLLHCCCAPCSLSCIESLRSEKIEPDLFWYNPNIHPFSEYTARRGCFYQFAANENIPVSGSSIDEYGLRTFLDTVYAENNSQKQRCEKCYRMRLEKTAYTAAQEGYEAFTTSLLISPYQNHETIKRIGEEAAAKFNTEFFYRDFRPLFRKGQADARTKGLYMQKYCGCILSEYINRPHPTVRIKNNQTHELKQKHIFQRLELLTGEEGLQKLQNTSVLLFGVGGVGSWCAEALVRSGIGKLGIVDYDKVCESNINRQLQATSKTTGQAKVEVLKKRLLEINPACVITAYNELFCLENAGKFGIENADYVIDAIDTVNHKLDLIETVCNSGITLFSSMGMALRLDSSFIKTASIWETKGCPLARLVRQGLRKRGFAGIFTVVYSDEQIKFNTDLNTENTNYGKRINGSIVTVTAAAGFLLANLVIQDVLQ